MGLRFVILEKTKQKTKLDAIKIASPRILTVRSGQAGPLDLPFRNFKNCLSLLLASGSIVIVWIHLGILRTRDGELTASGDFSCARAAYTVVSWMLLGCAGAAAWRRSGYYGAAERRRE